MRLPRALDVVRSPRGVPLAALRVPLLLKLLGANLLVVGILLAGWIVSAPTGRHVVWAIVLGVLVLGVGAALTVVALRPIRDLETVVARVWQGDFGARVERSAVADSEVLRVGAMFNLLLDGLAEDRARMKALAAEVIEVGDRERAALARELHDTTAQRLAALMLNISTAARDCRDPVLAERLAAARDAAAEVTNEVRLLAHTVHPRVLDDLGLVAALRKLARESSNGTGIDVDVSASGDADSLPRQASGVLYRVAEEAVRNAVRHAEPREIHLTLTVEPTVATLQVRDDGQGFDRTLLAKQVRRAGGLNSMRDRLTVVEGSLDVRTAPAGGGTTIVATIPLAPTSADSNRKST